MIVECIWEHNGSDSLIYAGNFPGAFTRGPNKEIALAKFEREIRSWTKWRNEGIDEEISGFAVKIIQEKSSDLRISDADSDVIFDTEREPLSWEEYEYLKTLALRSAACFQALYDSVPDPNTTDLPERTTFYGKVPRTAKEIYEHTKGVNAYYFGEIGVEADNSGSIYECRKRGFVVLERIPDYLNLPVFDGSYGEEWSLRKVLRRFIWHDRIHAKAMYRSARRIFGEDSVLNPFYF